MTTPALAQCLRTSGNLDILQAIHSRRSSLLKFPSRLPSWVPDWTSTEVFVPLRHAEISYPVNAVPEIQSQNCKATGDSHAEPEFCDDERILGLNGYSIGVIEEVSSTVELDKSIEAMYNFIHTMRDCERVAQVHMGAWYRSEKATIDRYWQTLCAGIMPGGENMSREEFRRHNAVMRTFYFFINVLELVPYLHSVPWVKILTYGAAVLFHRPFRSSHVQEDIAGFQGNFGAAIGRRIARTNMGDVCLVPRESVKGDSVMLLAGGKAPFVIRPDESGRQKEKELWRMIGEIYVHGKMKGPLKPDLCKEKFWFS